MYGDRNNRQVEVVKHDRDMVVEASPGVEVEAEGPAADQRNSCYLCQPEEEQGRVQQIRPASF